MKYGKLRMCLLGEDMFQSHASPIFMNIGDAVQGVAMSGIYQKVGIQGEETILLPRFSLLKHFSYPEAILLPYGSALSSNTINKTLPFPECIHPIFVSINAGSDFLSEDTGLIEYFKKHAPIGCRDEKTRNYFRRYGIRAYIMGCYTMTLDPPQQKESPANDNDTGKVITVDLSEKALQAIPDWIKRDSISMTHNEPFKTFPADETEDNRFYRCAKEYLGIYAAASLVITSRLHVAAPCIAMGVPVVLMSDNLDYRFEWIDKYIPCYQSSDYSKIDWLNIRAANKEDVAFAKKTLIDLYGAIISQNDYEPYLEALDNFYMSRQRFITNKTFKEKLEKFYGQNCSTYCIYGAGEHCFFVYEIMNELYPNAKLTCIVDKYKTGNRFGAPIISPLKMNEYDFSSVLSAC